jgi:hypothetical protein
MRKFTSFVLALAFAASLQPLLPAQTRAQQTAATRSSAASVSAAIAPATVEAAKRITAEQLSRHLNVVASDAMAGRNTPSPGLDEAAKYIADQLKQFKVKPAGDGGTYFQRMSLRRTEVDREKTQARVGERVFKVGEGFAPVGPNGGEAEGQIVYAGHGWVFKPKGMNPYGGLDVRDRVVVISGTGTSLPAGLTQADLKAAAAADWETPVSYAQKNGARALVIVPRGFERMWRFAARGVTNPRYCVERLNCDGGAADGDDAARAVVPNKLITILPSTALLDALFEGEQQTGPQILQASTSAAPEATARGFALSPAKRLSLSVALKTTTAVTQNVVAVVEGSDRILKNEYVAVGAHYDHVGVGREVNGDSIYNGADDDGSGTVAMLAMAEAFARGPRPKRSILFVWHAGEEHGLWGSDYFARYPTVPLDKIVTQLNMDMIGRSRRADDTTPANRNLSGPDEIYVIGSKMMSTELGELSERVNRAYLNLSFNYKYDDPKDPNRFFFRSDHYNYARRGVPIIFYFDGVHEDYHRPSDSPDKIDYRKLERVARTVFVTATEIANLPARPRVDKQLPSELSGR